MVKKMRMRFLAERRGLIMARQPFLIRVSVRKRLREGLKVLLVILGWAASIAAFTLQAIFQGQLLPVSALAQGGNVGSPYAVDLFYAGIFATSVLAAMILDDAGKAIISLLASYLLADVIVYLVIALPGLLGLFYPEVLTKTGISFAFAASFPIGLLLEMVGTFIGIALAERI
jgi:hypothetical protein